MGGDWRDAYTLERVEFARIRAVHFVVYGAMGRGAPLPCSSQSFGADDAAGTSSSISMDTLGKGFADFIRWRCVSF